jgi:methanogenic corrinoid protein MtbC1
MGRALLSPHFFTDAVFADKMGADFYGKDAMEMVRYAESLL